MRRIIRYLAGLLVATLIGSGLVLAEQASVAPPPLPEAKEQPVKSAPVYRPPPRGSPAVRVGGATRGADDPLPSLHVLAPDHIGLTVQAQPVFQWYLSKPATVRFEFALVRDDAIEPVLETDFGSVHSRGIQQLDLATTDITLEPGIVYQWSVALIPDEQARSGDVVASGMIERIAIPDELAGITNTDGQAQARVYAGAGIWYDAIAAMSRLIADNPADVTIRQQRAALLEQVGLPAVGLPDAM